MAYTTPSHVAIRGGYAASGIGESGPDFSPLNLVLRPRRSPRLHLFVATSAVREDNFVHIKWRGDKERRNIRKHGLDFSLAE